MAHFVLPAIMLGSVALLSGAVTYVGATYTLNTVATAAGSTTVKSNLKPTYIASLPRAEPEALNVARSVAVVWRGDPRLTQQQVAPAFTHTVAVESLRVRAGPKRTELQLFAIKGGTRVTVSEEVRGWVLIDADGRKGWVYGKLLRPAERLVAAQE